MTVHKKASFVSHHFNQRLPCRVESIGSYTEVECKMDKAIKTSVKKNNQISMRFNKSEPALFYEKREKAEIWVVYINHMYLFHDCTKGCNLVPQKAYIPTA